MTTKKATTTTTTMSTATTLATERPSSGRLPVPSAADGRRGGPGLATMLCVVAAVLASGCASSPDRYYTLAEPAAEMQASTLPAAPVPPLSPVSSAGVAPGATGPAPAPVAGTFIDIAPVAMPERLARPQLVVGRGGASTTAEVALLEQHRWTSSFESELRDALGAGIAARLGAVDVTKSARLAGALTWRIAVQLDRFDLVENRGAEASFSWTVRRADAERGTACRWSGSEPAAGGIDALALGARRLSGRVSAQIARHVRALQADPGAGCPQG